MNIRAHGGGGRNGELSAKWTVGWVDVRKKGETEKPLSPTSDSGLNPAWSPTVYFDPNSNDRSRTRTTMKKAREETAFGPDHLPLQIDDLPGVERSELSRHFPKRKRSREPEVSSEAGDPVRTRAVEGLGLSKGRRFFGS